MVPKTLKTFLVVFPIFFAIIFVSTWGILNGYFEQDEWLAIANVMNSYNTPWWHIYIPWVHFSPLAIFLWSTLYKIFNLQAQYYFLIQLIIHASVATLVFILSERIAKNRIIAIITGLLFLLNGRAHQTFTHLAIFHTTTLTMFFILLFFVYLSGIQHKVLSFKNALILALIFIAAVATREEGFIIIPIAVAYLICFDRLKINKKNIVFAGLFSFGLIVFILVRLFAQTLYTEPIPVQYQITGNGAEYNLVTLPIKFVVQNIIWSERIGLFFVSNTQKLYPEIDSFFSSQAPIMDAALFFIFGLIASIFILWFWLIKPKKIGSLMTFLLIWIGANSFMLSFIGRPIFVLEPRYLYFSSFPVLLFISIFLYSLYNSRGRNEIINFTKRIIVIVLFSTLLITSLQEIRIAVNYMSHSGIVKKQVFRNLLKAHPKLSNNTIFFVKCGVKCYKNRELGIPVENVLPFSSGPGMNILVTYASIQNQEKEWGPFFTKEWLFHTFSEGYKRIGDRSFGYFVTKRKLEEAVRKYNLSKDIIVALEYDEESYTLRDISKEFRKTMSGN